MRFPSESSVKRGITAGNPSIIHWISVTLESLVNSLDFLKLNYTAVFRFLRVLRGL
jgi:hypothetical protein